MTTVDIFKFPVNRFIIAASSVWKYKQFPHLIIGRIWGSLTLPRQRSQCATAELCLVTCTLSFLLFAFSRSPRLFPEIIKLIFSFQTNTCVRRKEMTPKYSISAEMPFLKKTRRWSMGKDSFTSLFVHYFHIFVCFALFVGRQEI